MKKKGLLLALTAGLISLYGGEITEVRNCIPQDGTLLPCRKTIPFLELDLKREIWNKGKTDNYSGLLQIDYRTEKMGRICLGVSRKLKNKKTDTAWIVETNPIPLNGLSSEAAVLFQAAGTLPVETAQGNSYQTRIRWIDANGEQLGTTALKYARIQKDRFSLIRNDVKIPRRAKKMILQFGFDGPNFGHDDWLAISDIRICRIPGKEVQAGMFETGIMDAGSGKISWKASTPAGTAIRFQLSSAPAVDGKTGKWSVFHGPDGTAKSFYTEPFTVKEPFFRLRVFLDPGKNGLFPKLLSMNIGGEMEWKWSMNRFPPVIEDKTESPTLNRNQELVYHLAGTVPANWSTFSGTIDGKKIEKFSREGRYIRIPAPAPYADGWHKITLNLTCIDGTKLESVKYLFIGKGANVPKVTLRDDGITLIGGKPFFPIGLYGVAKREFNNNDFDQCFRVLKENGFNFAQTYNKATPDYFAAAKKYGVRIWQGAYRSTAQKLKDNESVIAWYIGDDTSMHTTPQKLQDRRDGIAALDRNRIFTQADGIAGNRNVSNYHDYMLGTDNILPEIYPVHQDTQGDRDECVSKVIRDMQICHSDNALCNTNSPRSVWPIIQYFQGYVSWKRFPEENEIRAMSYAAIVYGAHGITWYTYGGYHRPEKNRTDYGVTSTPERWRIITTIAKELRELTPVLLERTPAQPAPPEVVKGPLTDSRGNPAVSVLLKNHNGKRYLITVNVVNKPVTAEIQMPGAKSGKVLFENRSITAKNGVFREEYKPYQVHVYQF